jgi:hypothetical protein
MNIDAFRWNLSMLGGCSLRGCSGSWNPLTRRCQVGVLDGLEVAGGALDTEPEQVTDAADVAAGGVDPAEDAVLAQCLRAQGGVRPREAVADRDESGCGASVDEQVRVGRVGQARARWPSHAVKRVRTGAATGMDLPSTMRRPSTMSVSCSRRTCLTVSAGSRSVHARRSCVDPTDRPSLTPTICRRSAFVSRTDGHQRIRLSASPDGETNLSQWRFPRGFTSSEGATGGDSRVQREADCKRLPRLVECPYAAPAPVKVAGGVYGTGPA